MTNSFNNPASFESFGGLLKFLRIRAGYTQRELAQVIGYHYAHLSRLESNRRRPDLTTVRSLLIPALHIEDESVWANRLMELALNACEAKVPTTTDTITDGEDLTLQGMFPFVGREQEYARLVGMMLTAQKSHGGFVLIEGEPGVGKSRLALEFADYARSKGMKTLSGSCYMLEQSMPYQPVIDILSQAIKAFPPESLQKVPGISLAELALLLPEIADHVNIPGSLADNDDLRKAQLFRGLLHFLQTFAEDKGLLVVIDDIHWASDATQQMIQYLARQISTQSILLICTYRGEDVAGNENLKALLYSLKRESHGIHMNLHRLSRDYTDHLLTAYAGQPVSANFRDWLYRETDGNPLFITSILQSLSEQGFDKLDHVVDQASKNHHNHVSKRLTLPDALLESVRSRLLRIPEPEKRILEIAAVFGRWFDFTTLSSLSGESGITLLSYLEDLINRQLLRELVEINAYDFSHEKIREVVYHDISRMRRTLLHLQIAETLEKCSPGRFCEQAATLAEHFRAGEDWHRAATYHLKAGDEMRRLSALSEAKSHFTFALDCLDHLPHSTQTRMQRTQALLQLDETVYTGETARDSMERLLEAESIARSIDGIEGKRLLAQVLTAQGRAQSILANHAEGYRLLQQALAIAQEVGDPDLIAIPATLVGVIYTHQGRFGQANALFEQALGPLEQQEDHTLWMLVVVYWATAQAARGQVHEALELAAHGLQRSIEMDNSISITRGYAIFPLIHFLRRDPEKTLEGSHALIAAASPTQAIWMLEMAYALRGWSAAMLGLQELSQQNQNDQDVIRPITGGRALFHEWFAAAEVEQSLQNGQVEVAVQRSKEIITESENQGGLFQAGIAHRVLASAALAKDPGNFQQAEKHFSESCQLFEEGDARLELARTHLAWGNALYDQEEVAVALQHWQQAADQFTRSDQFEELNLVENRLKLIQTK